MLIGLFREGETLRFSVLLLEKSLLLSPSSASALSPQLLLHVLALARSCSDARGACAAACRHAVSLRILADADWTSLLELREVDHALPGLLSMLFVARGEGGVCAVAVTEFLNSAALSGCAEALPALKDVVAASADAFAHFSGMENNILRQMWSLDAEKATIGFTFAQMSGVVNDVPWAAAARCPAGLRLILSAIESNPGLIALTERQFVFEQAYQRFHGGDFEMFGVMLQVIATAAPRLSPREAAWMIESELVEHVAEYISGSGELDARLKDLILFIVFSIAPLARVSEFWRRFSGIASTDSIERVLGDEVLPREDSAPGVRTFEIVSQEFHEAVRQRRGDALEALAREGCLSDISTRAVSTTLELDQSDRDFVESLGRWGIWRLSCFR
jgi:hypothetical protein